MRALNLRRTRHTRGAQQGWLARSIARPVARPVRLAARCVGLVSLAPLVLLLAGCGVAERPRASQAGDSSNDSYSWPAQGFHVAVLELKERGEIRIALYPQLAPTNVESFASRAEEGYYDGVTFHRVIKDFMIQGGDPFSRDDDPANDGRGHLDQTIADEFSDAPFLRGVVAVANEGRADSGGGQFFIMHQDQRGLDGQYTVLGRVIAGIHLVDDVALTQTDIGARWGPANRPIEDIVIESVRIERASDRLAKPADGASALTEHAAGAKDREAVKRDTVIADTKP